MPKRTRVTSPEVAEPAPGLWSNCIRVGDVVHVAGMTSRGADGVTIEGSDAYAQARIIFAKIRHLVEAAGGTMDDVAKVTIYVTDIGHNTAVWRARREFFTGDFPASTLVEVSALAKPEMLVEIEAVAYVGSSG
jgi:enamine deaminase RidA (YjgF/YER057c/UK114 family)